MSGSPEQYAREVLRDLEDRIAICNAAARALRDLYGLPEASGGIPPSADSTAPLAAVEDRPRRARRVRVATPVEDAPEGDVPQEVDGKYDAVIRRCLRDTGDIGCAAIDIALAWLPNRYDADDKKRALAGVSAALRAFEKRGQVVKNGRIWTWVTA